MNFQKAVEAYVAIIKQLQQNGAALDLNISHFETFINSLSTMKDITVDSFLRKLQDQLQQPSLYAMACRCDHMETILPSLAPTLSPEYQNNQNVSHASAEVSELPSEDQAQAATNAVQPNEPIIIATDNNAAPTALQVLADASELGKNVDEKALVMDLDFDENGAEEVDEPVPPLVDNSAPSLFNGRDFIVQKVTEYERNSDEWDWFKPDGWDSFILKNFLVVVDEKGRLLNDPAQGGWCPEETLYIQSKRHMDYACYERERALLDADHVSLYPTSPFLKAFGTPAGGGESDENGAGPSKRIEVRDCSYPVFTVETAGGINMQLRIMVMVVTKTWLERPINPNWHNNEYNQGGLVWPQVLDGLQGKRVYLKIRPSAKTCWYYGTDYMASSMWPTPPPRDDTAAGETPLKRQRTIPARYVVDTASIYSQKEASIKQVLPEITRVCYPCWIRQAVTKQSVGDRHEGYFAVSENFGMPRLDLLACYEMENNDKRVWIMIECDENDGHEDKNSEAEMERAFHLAANHSKWRPTDHLVFLRINPDACEEFGGYLEILDYEMQIQDMVEHICNQTCHIDPVEGTSELPIYYLFFPDSHTYADYPEGFQIPRASVQAQDYDVKYRISTIRDGKVREGGMDWK